MDQDDSQQQDASRHTPAPQGQDPDATQYQREDGHPPIDNDFFVKYINRKEEIYYEQSPLDYCLKFNKRIEKESEEMLIAAGLDAVMRAQSAPPGKSVYSSLPPPHHHAPTRTPALISRRCALVQPKSRDFIARRRSRDLRSLRARRPTRSRTRSRTFRVCAGHDRV
ncbi:hypothetical protein FISHEDRAFT_77117 [Fistulina hepatica ATCC 64428]|uniref:Uncharacterized protein n=1 Tax=Fistulina hepatica ATCC 64428 TaxID=1128425 RepID=A0A0D7A4S0_9AGAR|nr:hypothetical protein FISHEDRAFT_77117 [Fistulina hepatica ATCC 64428]